MMPDPMTDRAPSRVCGVTGKGEGMKIRVTMKDPDTMHDAVERAFKRLEAPEGVSVKEWEDICSERAEAARDEIGNRWMPYSEYLYVEFDLDAKTAIVLPASEFK